MTDFENGWERFEEFLQDVMNPFFPLKTRETFSTRVYPSGVTRKIQNEMEKNESRQ